MKYSYRINQKSLEAFKQSMAALNKELQERTVRAALREWGNAVLITIKGGITWNAPKMRAAGTINISNKEQAKKFKNRIWCGVGIRYDGDYPGWMSGMYNKGFRQWEKGRKVPEGRGKGWRKGFRRQVGGAIFYPTQFITKAYEQHKASIAPILQAHIAKAIKTVAATKAQRRSSRMRSK